ncbi:MAG: DUF488 domain-containing protein [Planctomycetia bacterium]|nr:DUF488 domain-containing protein [Planctomycetia bacterium]
MLSTSNHNRDRRAVPHRLFTVGHSTHPLEKLFGLLGRHAITAVADVRSTPFSRFNPQYNREELAKSLEESGIRYVFLGLELGARRSEPECYEASKVRYDLIAHAPLFRRGLDRVRAGLESFNIALLCAEKDPLTCHRSILICRHLRLMTGPICHILEDGNLETHEETESRLLSVCGLSQRDLFHTREELIEQAYDIQGNRIAYGATTKETEDALHPTE